MEDDLADGLARGEEFHRAGDLRHRVSPADDGFEFPGLIEFEECLPHLGDLRRILHAVISPVQADDAVVFNEDMVGGEVRELAAREADGPT